MKRIALVVIALALGGCGSLSAITAAEAQPQFDHAAFRQCVDREAPIVFAAAMKADPITTRYGYHTALYNEVISECAPRMAREGLSDTLSPSNSDVAYVNAAIEAEATVAMTLKEAQDAVQIEKQQKADAESERVEKQETDKAKSTYYACLEQHARALALVSAETADVVAQAALSSCPTERLALVDVMNRYVPTGGSEIARRLDASFANSLLLEIVEARAIKAAPKPKTPKPISRAPI